MANTKISALTAATTPLDGTEVLPIVQSSTTKKVANNDLRPKQIQSNATSGVMQIVGPATASTRVMTVPDANFTAARTDAAQSFTGDQTLGTGNLIQGTAAKGINFTANTGAAGMTSQLLNWYEEGTWTPAIASGGGTITAGTTAGYYTRVGRLVTFNCYVSVSSVSSPTGDVTFSGLPFTSFNNTYNVQAFSVYSDGLAAGATTSLVATMGGIATTFIVRVWSAGNAGFLAPYVTGDSVFRISGSYFV